MFVIEKKVNAVTVLKGYGEFGLGRPLKDTTRTNVISQNLNSTEFSVTFTEPHTFGRPLPAGHSSTVCRSAIAKNNKKDAKVTFLV